jgi:hypothetical protein
MLLAFEAGASVKPNMDKKGMSTVLKSDTNLKKPMVHVY